MRYSKYSGRGNFFSLPNEVFLLGLSAGELSVYSFLKRCENRKTHQCWPSIRTIGEAVRMSENTEPSRSANSMSATQTAPWNSPGPKQKTRCGWYLSRRRRWIC